MIALPLSPCQKKKFKDGWGWTLACPFCRDESSPSSPSMPSGGRRIEYSPRYNPSKRGRFKCVWDAQGDYADLD